MADIGTDNALMNVGRIIATAIAAVLLTVFSGAPQAQQTSVMARVGVLLNPAPNPLLDQYLSLMRHEFAKLGYVEGQNIAFELRYASGDLSKLPAFAAEFARTNIDIILAFGAPAAVAARNATTRFPIIYSIVTDPVAVKLAETMTRPGGNATGFTNLDPQQAARQIDLVKELLPNATRLVIFSQEGLPGADATGLIPVERDNSAAATSRNLQPHVVKIKGPTPDLDAAFAAMVAGRADALLVLETPLQIAHRKRIAELAVKHRLPAFFPGGLSDAGGLLTYGTSVLDIYARMPATAHKIFGGANPGEIPIEVISRRELIVNLKTAKEIGVIVPPEITKRADKVIE